MKFDVDFLQYVIKNRGYTIDSFISQLNMSKTTFYKKMNKPNTITYSDIKDFDNILDFTDNEVMAIFFKK